MQTYLSVNFFRILLSIFSILFLLNGCWLQEDIITIMQNGEISFKSLITVEDKDKELNFSDVDSLSSDFLKPLEKAGWKVKKRWSSKNRPYKMIIAGSGNLEKIGYNTDFYSLRKRGEKEYRIRFKPAETEGGRSNRSIAFRGNGFVFDLKGNKINKIDNAIYNNEYVISFKKDISKRLTSEAKERDKLATEAIEIIRNEIESKQYLISCNGRGYSLHYYKNYWALFNASSSGRVPVFNALLELKGGKYVATPGEITEVDKLNKVEWKGTVGYKITAMRYYPLENKNWIKGRPGWSEWIDPSRSGSLITLTKGMMESQRAYPLFLYSVLKKQSRWEYKTIKGVENKLDCQFVGKFQATEASQAMRIIFNTTGTGIISPVAPEKVSGIGEWKTTLTVKNNLGLWLEIIPGIEKKGVILKSVDCLASEWQEKAFGATGKRLLPPDGEIKYNVIYSKPEVPFYAEARVDEDSAKLMIVEFLATLPIPNVGQLDNPVVFLEFWDKVRNITSIKEAAAQLKSGNISEASTKLISILDDKQQIDILLKAFEIYKIKVSEQILRDFLISLKIIKAFNILKDDITLAWKSQAGEKPIRVSFLIK